MLKHPVFPKLWLHSDDELSEMLGLTIVERETLHEWPLSCVQRLTMADGTKLIYKSQLPPTIEPEFYQWASSQLLPRHCLLGKLEECETMTLEYIDAPLLSDSWHSEVELVEHGKRVIEQIGKIKVKRKLPVYLDLGSVTGWLLAVEVMVEKLTKLVRERQFTAVEPGAVEDVAQVCGRYQDHYERPSLHAWRS